MQNKYLILNAYSINQFPNHSIPRLCLWILGSILPISNNLEFVLVTHMLGYFCSQFHTVAFILIIS